MCTMSGGWHAHDLTSDQVQGRYTSNVVPKRLVSQFVLKKFIRHRYWKSYFQAQIYK